MAKIVLKRGSIYFLKEKDYLTGEITRFTKNEKKTSGSISAPKILATAQSSNNKRKTEF